MLCNAYLLKVGIVILVTQNERMWRLLLFINLFIMKYTVTIKLSQINAEYKVFSAEFNETFTAATVQS